MDIYAAIRQMALEGLCVADVGVASNIDEASGKCDVEIEGKAPATGAWLSCGGDPAAGVLVVPKEGSDVVVVWVSDVLAIVVMVASVAKVVIQGGDNGGLVKVAELTKKINAIEQDINTLKTIFTGWVPVPNDGGAELKAVTATWAGSSLAVTQKNDIENELITH